MEPDKIEQAVSDIYELCEMLKTDIEAGNIDLDHPHIAKENYEEIIKKYTDEN